MNEWARRPLATGNRSGKVSGRIVGVHLPAQTELLAPTCAALVDLAGENHTAIPIFEMAIFGQEPKFMMLSATVSSISLSRQRESENIAR